LGSRGPVPIPHARRRNKKTNVGKTVVVAAPDRPDGLEGEAQAEWERVVPELEAIGLIATVDRSVLIRYCRSWADWCEVDRNLQATGMLIKGRRDGLVRNPLFLLRSDLENTLSDLGKQLGLTPAARLRAGVEHQEQVEEDEVAPTKIAEYRRRAGL
jgi:P27 family predicted phage terminase small subunit